MLNDYSSCITVKACIVGEHRINVFGLVGEITRLPWTRYHDDRAYISQFTSHTLGQQRLSFLFSFCPLRTCTEDDYVKSLVRTSYMDLVNSRMIAEIASLRRSSVNK